MGLNNSYKKLFDLRFLHRYFLDEAGDRYPNNPNLSERFENNRLKYQLESIMRIVPTEKTKKILKNYKGIFRQYSDGVCVLLKSNGTKPFIDFDDKFILDFTIEIIDPLFQNYTDIEWDRSKLIYLSNVQAVNFVAPTPTPIPVLEEDFVPTYEDPIQPIAVLADKLSEYKTHTTGSAMNLNLLETIEAQELNNKFGLIRLFLTGDSGELSLVNPANASEFNPTTPDLDIFLRNRKTFWRFLGKKRRTSNF